VREAARAQRGIILIAVLFFIALLVSGVATFLRRATLDGMIARNRDLASRCEALARGGVQLATALLLQDRLDEVEAPPLDTRNDLWAKLAEAEIPVPDGGRLRLRIEDAGSRLNLNALFDAERKEHEEAEPFLTAFLEKVIGELEASQEAQTHDAAELARSLLDYIDENDFEEKGGGQEDDYYQLQSPPYRAANRPLLSIDELGLVEGFDRALIDAIRPYATVHPYFPGGGDLDGTGINPNTAPSHVLAILFHGIDDPRLANQQDVRWILERRKDDKVFCPQSEGYGELDCEFLSDETGAGLAGIYPQPKYTANVFQVTAEASYGDVRRTIEVVIDRSEATSPRILSWRVR
jgi:general secretion pathway protein K